MVSGKMCVCVCGVCMYMCMRERKRDRQKETEREGELIKMPYFHCVWKAMFYLEKQILELLPRLDFVIKFLFVCDKMVNSKMLWNREGRKSPFLLFNVHSVF